MTPVTRKFVLVLTTFLALLGPARAQTPPAPTDSEHLRIERLATLGRLWGTVKFLHPYLAYKDIDWDAALVAAIPKVRAAASAEEFRAAIDAMLAVLGDPATRTILPPAGAPPTVAAGMPAGAPAHRMIDDVIIMRCEAVVDLMSREGEDAFALALPAAADRAKANGVIVDCRTTFGFLATRAAVAPWWHLHVPRLVASMLDRPVTLGSYRYRQHSGYQAHAGISSGGYESGLMTAAPGVLHGERRGGALPIAFIVADLPLLDTRMLMGLQAAGAARIVKESAPNSHADAYDYSVLKAAVELSDGVVANIRGIEWVGPTGEVGLRPDAETQIDPATSSEDRALGMALASLAAPRAPALPGGAAPAAVLRPSVENPYAEMQFPNAEYRLLSLFRLWNVINYFFAYKHLMDQDWSKALTEFIPRFEASRNQLDYEMTLSALTARLQDSHVRVGNAAAVEREYLGMFSPPITVSWIEGQTVITALPDEKTAAAAGLSIGDIIVAVDDEPVNQRRARLEQLFAASTPQRSNFTVNSRLLRGPKDMAARLRIKSTDEQIREVVVPRTADWWAVGFPGARREPPIFGILQSGYGYIDLTRLALADVDKAMDAVRAAPGLIFDMRGYPNGTGWTIASRLVKDDRTATAASVRRPFVQGKGEQGALLFSETVEPSGQGRYRGKVVMLIDEQTMSQAEYVCQQFAAATDVIFIGSPTAGANGDVTTVVLPGNLTVSFTGHDWRHADGHQLQRIGIQPHVKVEPTIGGIRAGRDEVLEAALKYLDDRPRN